MKKVSISKLEEIAEKHSVIKSVEELKQYHAYPLKRRLDGIDIDYIAVRSNSGEKVL